MVEGTTVEDLIRKWEGLWREIVELERRQDCLRLEQEEVITQAKEAMKASDEPGGWIVDNRFYFLASDDRLEIQKIVNLPGGSR